MERQSPAWWPTRAAGPRSGRSWQRRRARPLDAVVRRLTCAAALLSAALRLVHAQEAPSEPSTFVWGSVSNMSLTLTVGSAKRRALVVAGVVGTLGSRDRAARVGAGGRFRSEAARTRVLRE